MGTPRISVTVLNYNYGQYLPGCLDSILGQTFGDFAVTVIDDCSSDNSRAVVRPYLDDARVKLVAHEANRGYLASLCEGTDEHSAGEFVMVISADDFAARKDALERQVRMLDEHSSAAFCFSGFEKRFAGAEADPGPHRSFSGDVLVPGNGMLRRILCDNGVQVLHSGTLVRRNAYERAGRYDRTLRFAPDTALWLALCLDGDAAYVDAPLYGYRIHASQMSGIGSHRAQMVETVRIIESACDAAARRGTDVRGLRRASTQAYLFGAAMDEAFRGKRRLALQRARVALALRPRETVTSRYLWIVMLRALLGERAFGAARSTGRRVLSPLR
jgi:hypothetical protein